MTLLQNGEQASRACHILIKAACLGDEKYPVSGQTETKFFILSARSFPLIMLSATHWLKTQQAHCLCLWQRAATHLLISWFMTPYRRNWKWAQGGDTHTHTLLEQREIRKFVIKKRQALVWHVISLLAWSKPAPSRLCHQQGQAQVSPLNLSQQSLIWTLGSGFRLRLQLEADNRDTGRWGSGGMGRGRKRQSLFLTWLPA